MSFVLRIYCVSSNVTLYSCYVSLSSQIDSVCISNETNEICLHKSVTQIKKKRNLGVANFVRGILLWFETVFTVYIKCVIVFLFHCFKQQKAGVVKWDQVWPLLKKINVNLICLVFKSHSYSHSLFFISHLFFRCPEIESPINALLFYAVHIRNHRKRDTILLRHKHEHQFCHTHSHEHIHTHFYRTLRVLIHFLFQSRKYIAFP